MPQTTWNKGIVPAGTDPYNEIPDTKKAVESLNAIVPVANGAERDALAPTGGKYVGMTVSRADLSGILETWDGLAWIRQAQTGSPVTSDANWSFNGGLSRQVGADRNHVTMSVRLSRAGGSFTLSTTYLLICPLVPLGWRPPLPAFASVNLHAAGGVYKATLPAAISATGDLLLQTSSGSVTVNTGDYFHLCADWPY
ncbi:hypothetical protein QF038_000989 [Pseudarthrobacter sp. W1I19]|nr:hypothetical protein [Pseudarthrobacter sp. W1I19]